MKKVLLSLFVIGVSSWTMAQSPKLISPNKSALSKISRQSVPMNYTGGEPMGMPAKPVVPNPSVAGINETVIGTTYYDLQTNASICKRLINHNTGELSATWTFSVNASGFPNRGTGYNFYDGSAWGTAPTTRLENTRTGWTNIGVTNTGKEVNISHGTSTNTLVKTDRATYGAGAWTNTNLNSILPIELWPRMVVEGNTIHVIGLTAPTGDFGGSIYNGMNGAVLYTRSTDGGSTWSTPIQLPGLDVSNYESIGGDNYNIDVRGDVVAVAVADLGSPVRVWKSTDAGLTWTAHKALDNGIEKFVEATTLVDTIGGIKQTSGGSISVLIDNNDMVHVVFDQIGFSNEDLTDGSLSIFMFSTFGLGYWNENMEEGQSVIISDVYWDWDADGQIPTEITDNIDNFRYGNMNQFAQMPSMSIDASNNIYLTYSALTEYTDFAGGYYRHVYGLMSPDAGCTWSFPWDLTAGSHGIIPVSGTPIGDDDHETVECTFASTARTADSLVYFIYSKDDVPGRAEDGAGAVSPSFNEIIFKVVSVEDFQAVYGLGANDCNAYVKETKCNGSVPELSVSCGTAYHWSTGDTTSSILAPAVGDYTVVVTTTCVNPDDTTLFIMDTVTVHVDDVDSTFDQPVVTNTNGILTVCEGDNVVLLEANGGVQYVWSNGSYASSITLTDVAETGSYFYLATDECGNMFYSDTVDVFIYPNVESIINGSTEICIDSTTLTATTFTAASYQWSTGSTGTSIVAYDGDVITLIVSNSNCSDTSTVTVVKLPATPTAMITATGGVVEVCEGDTIMLTATGGATYAWSTTATTASINVTTPQTGYVSVEVTDICGNSDTDSIMVTVNPKPATPVITGNKPTLTFTSNTAGSTGHQWYINGNPVSGNTGNTYTATNWTVLVNNPVWVTYTDANGCTSDPSNTIIMIPTGVEELSSNSFRVYPNPTNGELFIQNLADFNTLTINNLVGQTVLTKTLQSNITSIDMNAFGEGIYFITLSSKTNSAMVKVIVK